MHQAAVAVSCAFLCSSYSQRFLKVDNVKNKKVYVNFLKLKDKRNYKKHSRY